MQRVLKVVLSFQGLYYLLTGLWSVIDIDSFSRFTQYQGDYFLKHTAGVLFSILGLLFVYSVVKKQLIGSIKFFAFLTALGVVLVEVLYLEKIGNPLPFQVDFVIELTIAFLLFFLIIFQFKRRNGL